MITQKNEASQWGAGAMCAFWGVRLVAPNPRATAADMRPSTSIHSHNTYNPTATYHRCFASNSGWWRWQCGGCGGGGVVAAAAAAAVAVLLRGRGGRAWRKLVQRKHGCTKHKQETRVSRSYGMRFNSTKPIYGSNYLKNFGNNFHIRFRVREIIIFPSLSL
jgi:hypothetical protein